MEGLLIHKVLYLLGNALVLYSYYRIYEIYFNRSNVNRRLEVGCFVAHFLINSTCFIIFATPYLNLATNIIPLIGIAFLYPGRVRTKLAVPLLCFSLSMILDNFVWSMFMKMSIASDQMLPMANMSVAIIWNFVVLVLRKRKAPAHHYRIEFLHWLAICFIPIGSMAVIVSMFYYNEITETVLITSFVLFFINVLVFYLFDTLGKYYADRSEKQLLEQQNHAYREEFALMQQAERQVRTLRHDMKNHLTILRQYADDERKADMDKYLDEFTEKLTHKTGYVHTGNPDLDSILNYKLGQAEAADATLTVNVSLPEQLEVDVFDLNVVLGNLLDNATEGMANAADKHMNLSLHLDRGVLFIHVDNTYDGVVNIKHTSNTLRYRTRKKDNALHGLGLDSVQTVVEKYHGQMEINSEGNLFEVKVMLYLLV